MENIYQKNEIILWVSKLFLKTLEYCQVTVIKSGLSSFFWFSAAKTVFSFPWI